MARILGAVALVLALAAGAWWFTRSSSRPIGDAVAPGPSPATQDPTLPASAESLRSVAEPPPEESASPGAVESPGKTVEKQPPTGAPVEDLTALDPYALEALKSRLEDEIEAATAEELGRRHAAGMGEFMGAGEGFDIGSVWDPARVMSFRVVNGAVWRVILPREEFPEAYALLDRKLAVVAELRSRGK